jgi:hypothetical protein
MGVGGLIAAVAAAVAIPAPASADPLPGFEFDPVALEQRMDDCLALQSPPDAVLMAWINLRTAQQRTWRCSSLRHMMRYDGSDGPPHDPSVNLPDFMRCVDEVVSFGFPRKNPLVPSNVALIKQYNGTSSTAIVAINDLTGDIATIYTLPRADDWTGCAEAL